jgi:adenosylhomocysteinase
MRARGMGARVIVTEVDALRALEAVMDGYRVMPLEQAAEEGDVFVTLTGNLKVVRVEHFQKMKDGAIVANSGHFNVELDLEALDRMAQRRRIIRPYVEEYTLADGKRIYVLGEGRLINLAAAEGHPACVMDMSFANQALVAEYLVKEGRGLEKRVYGVPRQIDDRIAELKLAAMQVTIDTLTAEQETYLASWEMGT